MRNRIQFKDRCGGAIIEWKGKVYIRIMKGMPFKEGRRMSFQPTERKPFCASLPKAPKFDYAIGSLNTDYDGDAQSVIKTP